MVTEIVIPETDIIFRKGVEEFLAAAAIRLSHYAGIFSNKFSLPEKILAENYQQKREREGETMPLTVEGLIRKKLSRPTCLVGLGLGPDYEFGERVLKWAFANRKFISLWIENKPGWLRLRDENFLGDRLWAGQEKMVSIIQKNNTNRIPYGWLSPSLEMEEVIKTSLSQKKEKELLKLLVHDAGSKEWELFEKKTKIPHNLVARARGWEGLKV